MSEEEQPIEFDGLRFDVGKQIPFTVIVKRGEDEKHAYKFSFVDPNTDRTTPGTLQWDGAKLDFLDVPDEWIEVAKEGLEEHTRYDVELL